jgi:ABC-type antimicrobial peptide transport system permease subunit
MIVAGVGIYGMAAYSINRKQREIGLRIALGARRSRILALVLRESTITALLGTLIGGLAAFAATRWSAGLLRVPPPTWTGFIVCFVVLLALSCLAVLAPAVRTLRIEPSAALKGS